MTKAEMLEMMRLLSAIESILLSKESVPVYLSAQIDAMVQVLEREILK